MRTTKRSLGKTGLGLVISMLLILASSAIAQNTSGSIVGRVTDSTGAVVPNITVVVTNRDTGESRRIQTNEAGDYSAPLLKPGAYTVTIAQPGFKTSKIDNIVVQVDQTVRADTALSVGEATEGITVNATALTLDTDTSTIGQVINEKQITQLPLNGRAFYDLIFLAPGAVQTGGEQANRVQAGNAISIGGARTSSNGYTVDGTNIMDMKFNTPAYNMSLDAIEEFKLQTKTYSAAYGYSVNQVTLSSKAGTNLFHGSVFEFIRNDALDARNYFNRPPNAVSPLRQNQFGYSLGGPVWIPKVYDGHNRTFFFANYEGQRIRTNANFQGNVPTADQLQGRFGFAVKDPSTGIPFPMVGGVTTLPANRISRLGQLVQSKPTLFFPAPNSSGLFNYSGALASPLNVDQQNYRIDQNFEQHDQIFFRATKYDLLTSTPAGAGGSGGLTSISNQYVTQASRNYTLVYTHIFKPNLINQLRFGYLEAQAKTTPFAIPSDDLSALGLSGTFHLSDGGYPNIQFQTAASAANGSIAYAGTGGSVNTPSSGNQPLSDLSDSVSWTIGRHTLNFGFGMQWFQFDPRNTTNPYGELIYNGQFSGNQISDLLLGAAYSASASTPGPLSNINGDTAHLHYKNYAPYIQDDWKVTPSLTLNLGLRYEFHATPYEEQNEFGWFTHNAPGGALIVANPTVASKYGNGFYQYNGKRGDGPAPATPFAPRIGFAYRLFGQDKTVLRGGYGLFYDTIALTEMLGSVAYYPYANTANLTQSTSPGPINTDNLFPTSSFGPVSAATLTSSLYLFMPEKYKVPYIQNWTLDIQRQLTPATTLDVNYEGSKGTRLFQRINANQPHQCAFSLGCDPNTQTAATLLARRPYPNFGTILEEQFTGWSNYNAMDVKVEHRSRNLTALAVYTYSKLMDDKSASAAITGDAAGYIGVQNTFRPQDDYARASYDVGQRFALSFVGLLPVGRGQHFLGTLPRYADLLIGGWQANGIYQLQKGFPFTISATDINFVNEGYAERADQVSNPYPAGFKKGVSKWMNTAAFAQPLIGNFGNSSRNVIRGPGADLLNFSLFKNFHITERLNFEFRAESFNTLNHPQFADPDQSVNSSTFGVISSTSRDNRELQFAGRLTF